MRITVIGRDNACLHENVLPQFEGPCEFRVAVPAYTLAYPSELKPDDSGRPYFVACRLPPVTDLALVEVHAPGAEARGDIRLWIESDAIACMSAIEVAGDYRTVTSLRYPTATERDRMKTTDMDNEFRRLFEPYDGSGRFNFRREVFSQGAFDRDTRRQ